MRFIVRIMIVLAFLAPSLYSKAQPLIPFVGENKKYGYKNNRDSVIIAPVYIWASGFLEGVAIVNLNNNRGFIDTKGKVIFPLQYEEADFFYEGLARVKKDGKWGFVDKRGVIKIPFIYDMVLNFKDGYSEVKLNDEKYKVNYAGEKEGPRLAVKNPIVLVAFKNNKNKFGYKDAAGKIIIQPVYTIANKFGEGIAAVTIGLKWFLIDINGSEIAALKGDYDFIAEFSEGLVAAVYNFKFGFLDKSGKTVIDFKYDEAADFVNGIAKVEMNGEKYTINKEGRRAY